MDTIFALATAVGKAGVAIIRVSGPQAFTSLKGLVGVIPSARTANFRKIVWNGQLIDSCLILTFEGPASFTGEHVVEYHTHGSVAVVNAVQSALADFDGHRLAEPGEFTRRALSNGKMDLTQVEGLADLIEASTEAQRDLAQRLATGGFAEFVGRTRASLIRAAALLEAVMDFADEDVPVDVTPEVSDLLDGVTRDLEAQIGGFSFAERVRTGFEVAIVGPPNVGKSTLLNYLAGREAAITSSIAGTTRDVIEVQMDLEGIPVTVLDTAGLRETDDEVEKIGVARARDRALLADIRVFLTSDVKALDIEPLDGDFVLQPKSDVTDVETRGVSGTTGAGVSQLVEDIRVSLENRVQKAGLATRERHVAGLNSALASVQSAMASVLVGPEVYDIAAEDMRSSLKDLSSIIGHVDVENLLDEIFSSFCLGK